MKRRGWRRRRADGMEGRDRWMITYADLITLLLIFFVVMYAMSSLDEEKYGIVTDSLSHSLHSGSGILDGRDGLLDGDGPSVAGNGTDREAAPDGSGIDSGSEASDTENGNGGPQASPPPGDDRPLTEREQAFREQEERLAELMGVITRYVSDNNLGDQIFVEDKPQGIAITLSDRFLFDIGRAALKAPAYPALRQLSGLFRDLDATVSIEGHTDNTPLLSGGPYRDNWELSGARALSVLRFFLEQSGLAAEQFQYAGYADTRPAADNETAEGRQLNRRVEIIVLRQLQGN